MESKLPAHISIRVLPQVVSAPGLFAKLTETISHSSCPAQLKEPAEIVKTID